jgi:hypothetical protein
MLYGGFSGFETPHTARPFLINSITKSSPTIGLLTGSVGNASARGGGPFASTVAKVRVYLGASE